MKRKLKKRRGFTLTETLIVIFILSLMTAAGVVGISSVLATRMVMVQAADADVLGSTAFQAIANELRFGQDIKVSADSVTLDSVTYGTDATLSLDDNGKLVCGTDGAHQVLGDKAYSGGLSITTLKFEENSDAIKVTLEISNSKGVLSSVECSVVPLNKS